MKRRHSVESAEADHIALVFIRIVASLAIGALFATILVMGI